LVGATGDASPTALHAANTGMLREAATRSFRTPNLTGRLIRPSVDKPFVGLEPKLLLKRGWTSNECYGVPSGVREIGL
jgi:hypothetical protein